MTDKEPAPHEESATPSICYSMAYFFLPRYLADDPARVFAKLRTEGNPAAASFYVMTCLLSKVGPRPDLLRSFRLHSSPQMEMDEFFVIEYPDPPRLELSDLRGLQTAVLAPHFTALVRPRQGAPGCFVLGQSPLGGTTLRQVTTEINANMGPGCRPDAGEFAILVAERCKQRL